MPTPQFATTFLQMAKLDMTKPCHFFTLLLFIISVFVIVYFSTGNTMSAVGDKFKIHGVVRDVIQKAPQQALEVRYATHKVDFGNVLTPTQVKDQPIVHWPADENSLYTLVFTDPDVPNRDNPINGQFKHWLVANIPGNKVGQGETLAEYVGSGPPQGSGLHRYVFLAYKQPNGKINDDEPFASKSSTEGRRKWKVEEFAAKHNLEGPIAGNFYQAEYDDYVPTVHAQLGFGK